MWLESFRLLTVEEIARGQLMDLLAKDRDDAFLLLEQARAESYAFGNSSNLESILTSLSC